MRIRTALMYAGIVGFFLTAGPHNSYSDGPAPRRATARFEVTFLQDMIDHHHMAVMMAELCQDRAEHSDLLVLCEEIATTQTAEIEEMQVWLSDWYGIEYSPRMTRAMERQITGLEKLDGARFEVEFMQMMIKHHQKAIQEANGCRRKASHESLIELCESIVATQTSEIEQMRSWLCSWYERCHGIR